MSETVEAIFERYAEAGFALALVYDDDGRWAVSDSGSSPVVDSENGHTVTVCIANMVEPERWKPSVREAVAAFVAANPFRSQQG